MENPVKFYVARDKGKVHHDNWDMYSLWINKKPKKNKTGRWISNDLDCFCVCAWRSNNFPCKNIQLSCGQCFEISLENIEFVRKKKKVGEKV